MAQVIAVVLAGGGGTRLWPLSTPVFPKPFLSPLEGASLYRRTLERQYKLVDRTAVIAGNLLLPLCEEQARGLDIEFVVEPSAANTAAAIALAAMTLKGSPDDLLLFLPADAWIQDSEAYQAALQRLIAAVHTRKDRYGVLGIVATRPAIEYGYIQASGSGHVRQVHSFTEKPALSLAQTWWERDDYFWNAGIFVFRRAHLLDLLQEVMREDLNRVREYCVEGCIDSWNKLTHTSIDYALAEKTGQQAILVPLDAGWSDVGTLENWQQIQINASKDSGRDSQEALGTSALRIGQLTGILSDSADFVAVRGAGGLLLRQRNPAV